MYTAASLPHFHGGTLLQLRPRVADSPLHWLRVAMPTAETGGVSSTGYGEAIMKMFLQNGHRTFCVPPLRVTHRAAQAAVQLLAKRGKGPGGLISSTCAGC